MEIPTIKNFNEMDLTARTSYLHDVLKEKFKLEDEITKLNKRISAIEASIVEDMIEEGVDSIEVDKVHYSVVVRESFTLDREILGEDVKVWDNEHFFKWLEETGNQGLIKLKESVHPSTRNAFLKKHVQEGGQLPDFIKYTEFPTLDYNKAKIKRLAIKNENS